MLDLKTRDSSADHCRSASMNGTAAIEQQPAAPYGPSKGLLEKLVAALDQSGASAKASQAGIEREAIFELVRRAQRDAAGLGQAIKEATHAAAIARNVIADAEYNITEEAFVESLLNQVAATTRRGDFEAGANAVDDALAGLQKKEEHSRQSWPEARKALLEAGLKQDLLRRDSHAAAQRIEAIAAVDAKDAAASWSPTYWRRLKGFLVEGEAEGINLPLEIVIAMARRMLQTPHDAGERSAAFILLGNAQRLLGTRENGPGRLTEAAASYREGLKGISRESLPREWASTQTSLAAVLAKLGEREGGTAWLKEAVAAYRDALTEQTRESSPLEWAATQANLGNVLGLLGEREDGTARFREAVVVYRGALTEQTREHLPFEWAATQIQLGTALYRLGERESGTSELQEAVCAFRQALQGTSRARMPLQWAMTQNNLGLALALLGERDGGTARLEEAAARYREALKEYTRPRLPLDWASMQNNLGLALTVLGERETGTARLEEAVISLREALEEFTQARVPPQWSATQTSLGKALLLLGAREAGTGRLEEATTAFREALKERTRPLAPVRWARTTLSLAEVSLAMFDKTADAHHLDEALEAAEEAFDEFSQAKAGDLVEKAAQLRAKILAAKGA